jgi:hypothetical protein
LSLWFEPGRFDEERIISGRNSGQDKSALLIRRGGRLEIPVIVHERDKGPGDWLVFVIDDAAPKDPGFVRGPCGGQGQDQGTKDEEDDEDYFIFQDP